MPEEALVGVRVLDLSDTIAGAYCTRLLADLGAEVFLVEQPDGHPLRRTGPFPGGARHPEKSGLFLHFCANKRGAVLDFATPEGRARARELAAEADLVVESRPPSTPAPEGLDPASLQARNQRLVITSVTEFGLTGPYKDWQGEEIVHWAMGGYMHFVGSAEREPLLTPNHQAQQHAGGQAAIASLVALRRARIDGLGQHVDQSVMEAMLAAHNWTTTHWVFLGEELRRTGSQLLRCKNGWAHFEATSLNPNFLLLAERPDLLDDPRFAPEGTWAPDRREALLDVLRAWCATVTKEEAFERAQELGLPVAPAYDVADHMASPHLQARGWPTTVEHPAAGAVPLPGFPYIFSESPASVRRPAPLLGEYTGGWTPRPARPAHAIKETPRPPIEPPGPPRAPLPHPPLPRPPLEDIRVLEITNNWAGPVTCRMLGDLGAEVIKIESPTRLAARIGQFAGNQGFERYWDRCSYFLEMNRSKYGVSIDLSTSRGRAIFLRLVEDADVVVENNTPRVMRNLDLEYPALKAVNPAIIMLSISGFGQTEPGRDYSAFGSNIEAACGIASLTGYAGDDQPYNTTNYYADPIATVHAPVALLAALEYRDATGRGQYIDMALNEGGIVFCSEAFMEYGLTGRVPERRGNRHPRFAPQGCYPSMGNDAWMVLTVRSDKEWRRLREVVGAPRLNDPRFDTEAGRRAGHDEIDEALAAWSAGLDHYEAARRLQAAGVPAGPVLANWEMISDLHAHQRGFYVMLPTRRVGAWVHSGMPWHFSRTPGVIRRDSPAYGEHNRLVLERLLGMRPEEIDALYRDRVVTEDPPERYLLA